MSEPRIYSIRCDEPGLLWYEFAQAVGAEELKQSFGWDAPPQSARSHENVWRVFDTQHPRRQVGWYAIRQHPCDKTIGYLMRGIFPNARRLGYRVGIGEEAAWRATRAGIKYLAIEILHTNEEHLRRHYKESGEGPWKFAGRVTIPQPTTQVFVRTL